MKCHVGGLRPLLLLPFASLLAVVLTTELHAQTCDLSDAPQAVKVDAASSTRFVPSGNTAEVYVQRKHSDTLVVRVFETNEPQVAAPKQVPERLVLSIQPAPEKNGNTSFTPGNSSVVRFVMPTANDSLWQERTFVIRLCDSSTNAQNTDPKSVVAIVGIRISPPVWSRLISLCVLALFYVAFALAVSHVRARPQPLATKYPAAFENRRIYSFWEHLNPVLLMADSFNRGSIQKLQVLLFTFLVAGMVFTIVLTLGYLTDLSPTVAGLLGISAVGAAVAQTTTGNRDRLSFDNWAWLVKKGVLPINTAEKTGPQLSDLVMTNRAFDIYKLQTLIFSVVVAVALLVGGEENLGNFTVPSTLLGILGLSQIAYVSGALAAPPSVADLDAAVTNLRSLETKLQTALALNIDTDADGKLPNPLPSAPVPPPALGAPNAKRLYKTEADQVLIMIESTYGEEVRRELLNPEIA
jgi:hypothetical protein